MISTEAAPISTDITELRKKAEGLGIRPGEMKKAELIRTVQMAEGYFPCFGESGGQCGHTDCCFFHDCLTASLTESRRTEEDLRQRTSELAAANEQLKHEIDERERAENELREYRDRIEQRLREQTEELASTSQQLEHQTTQTRKAENELTEYRDRIEQRLREQVEELTATQKLLQRETVVREQAEESLALLEMRLDNTTFLIRKYLELRKIRPGTRTEPLFSIPGVARLSGTICGSVMKRFPW